MTEATGLSIRPEALRAFMQLVEQEGSADELFARLRSDSQRLLLERAAIPRFFTRAVAESVLLRGLEGTDATWAWLVAHVDVEPVRAHPGAYHIRDSVRDAQRDALLAARDSDPQRWERFLEVSGELAKVLDANDAREATERIHHCAVAAPDECAHLFTAAFDAANAENDFGECEHLLATVDCQLRFVEAIRTHPSTSESTRAAATALQDALDDRERLFSARRRFAEELRRSAHTLVRRFMRDKVRELGQPTNRWIVNVEGEGGRGKTAFINWMIARKLVPSRIPVAKVDFDNPTWSNRQYSAWEFLLHIATELNVQLRGAPLTTLIDEIRAGLSSDMDVSSAQSRRRGEAANVVLEADLAEDVPRRLGVAIAEATKGPVVIVLDTLEELKLRNLASLADVVDTIARVQSRCPQLRLFLSGRFNLAERHADMWATHGEKVRVLRIPDFTEDEAIDFLMVMRKLKDRDLAAAIATKANRRPFQLALAADLVQSRGGLTREQVDSLGNLDLHYLVDRVLTRIDDVRVRWLIRYGVVPRALTRDFVVRVMLPELRVAMSGDKTHDDPDLDPTELRREGQQFEVALPSPDAPLDIEEVWSLLEGYASRCSFVSVSGDVAGDSTSEPRDEAAGQSTDPSGALVFHGDVRLPMRRVLQEHAAGHPDSVYARLHARARSIALAEAEEALGADDGKWEGAMARALYHAFQLSTESGEETWELARAAMESERASDEGCERVALELTLPEYVDDDGIPLLRGGDTPMISAATLAQARFEAAQRAVAIARRADEEGRASAKAWARASEGLEAIERLRERDRGAKRSVSFVDLTLLRADVLANGPATSERGGRRTLFEKSLAILDAATRKLEASERQDRLRYAVAMARLEPPEKILQTIDRLRDELAATEGARMSDKVRSEALVLLGDLAMRALRMDVAQRAADEHVRIAESLDPLARARALVRQAYSRWLVRDSERALERCRECKSVLASDPQRRGVLSTLEWVLQLEGEIHLWRRDYEAIDRLILEIEQVVHARPPARSETAAITTLSAYVPLLVALRDIAALRADVVPQSLERARARYERLGDHERLMFLLYSEMNYCYREMRDARAGESQARRIGRTRADDADVSTVRARALAYEVFVASGSAHEAEAQLRGMTEVAGQLDARNRLLVYVRQMVVGGTEEGRALLIERVVEVLDGITPVSLRMRVLADQLHPGEELDLAPHERWQLLQALGGDAAFRDWSLAAPSPDAIRQAIDVARVAIALKRFEPVHAVLDALAPLARQGEWFGLLTLVQALEIDAQRHGYSPQALVRADRVTHWCSHFDAGMGVAVALLQEGELHRQRGDHDQAAAFGRLAVQTLAAQSFPLTIWHALAHELVAACSQDAAEREGARNAAIAYHALKQDERALERLAKLAPAEKSQAAHPVDAPTADVRERRVARVTFGDASLGTAPSKTLQVGYGSRQRVETYRALPGDAASSALTRDAENPSSLGLPQESLARLLEDWEGFCGALGGALRPAIDDRLHGDAGKSTLDLQLQIDPRVAVLQGLPWELGRDSAPEGGRRFLGELAPDVLLVRALSGQPVLNLATHERWLQRMTNAVTGLRLVVDGIFGRATTAALTKAIGAPISEGGGAIVATPDLSRRLIQAYARSLGLERPRMFLMAGDSSLSLRRGMRSRDALGSGNKVVYRFEGYATTTVDGQDHDDVLSALRREEFEVIVLTGQLRFDTRRGAVVFDFKQGTADGVALGSGIDVPFLAKMLEHPDRPISPVVIVDAQVSGSASERLRMLLLRNLFCAELAAKSNLAAVVGTGLDNEHSLGPSLTNLLDELRACNSLADVVHRLRSAGADTRGAIRPSTPSEAALLHAVLPSRGIALWSEFPHDVFLPGAEPRPQ